MKYEKIPVLDIILNEIKKWMERNNLYQAEAISVMNFKTVAIATVIQIAFFLVVKGMTYSWAAGQATCLAAILGVMIYLATNPKKPVKNLVAPVYLTTLIFVPIMVIVGLAKTSIQDFIYYTGSMALTMLIVKKAWDISTKRIQDERKTEKTV